MVLDSSSRCASRFSALSNSWPLSRASAAKSVRPAFTRSTLVWIMLVEWAMPSVWRSTMPTISLTSRTVSLIWPKPDWAARLRSTPVLISVVTAPASRVSSPMVEAIWLVAARVSWASFFTSAATTAKLRPASPARAASMVAFKRQHVGLAGDRLDGRGDGLDLVHRRGEAGHALAQLDDQLGQALEAVDRAFDGFAAGVELGLGLLGQQPRLVGGIGHARLVAEQPRGHVLEAVEHPQMLADAVGNAVDVAGDIAALHRQRPAIARDRADRVLGDFLDPLRGHVAARSPFVLGAGLRASSYSFVNHARAAQ